MTSEGSDLPDFTEIDLPARMTQKVEDGTDLEEGDYTPWIRRGVDEMPFLTPDEEEKIMTQQVEDSKGFDIDFKKFRCVFNYRPVNFNEDDEDLIDKSDTTQALMDRLSKQSLLQYNHKRDTHYEFDKVLKANYHCEIVTGTMFFITFQATDPSDSKPKQFQAKVCNFYWKDDKHVTCDLKPEKKRDHSSVPPNEEDAKRLEEEAKRQRQSDV